MSVRHRRMQFTLVLLALCMSTRTLSAAVDDDPVQQPVQGFTEPKVTINVAFSQPGRVNALEVEEGSPVKQGMRLAELDYGGLEVSIEIAKARAADDSKVAAAEANVQALEFRLEELQRLAEAGGASPEEVRRVSTELDVAKANLRGAEVEMQTVKLDVTRMEHELERHSLLSPIDGFVTQVHKRPGEYVSANEPEVLEIVQLDPLQIRFFVPSALATELSPEQDATLWLPQLQDEVTGSIQRISLVIDPESDTVEVYVQMPNPELKYRAGLKCVWRMEPSEATPEVNNSTEKNDHE